jgi:hypothetical protein
LKSGSGTRAETPNENKMSDGGQGRASLGVEVMKSSQKWSVQRSGVRSIAWLGLLLLFNILQAASDLLDTEGDMVFGDRVCTRDKILI